MDVTDLKSLGSIKTWKTATDYKKKIAVGPLLSRASLIKHYANDRSEMVHLKK